MNLGFLTEKIGPLPAIAWVGIGGLAYLLLRGKVGGSSSQQPGSYVIETVMPSQSSTTNASGGGSGTPGPPTTNPGGLRAPQGLYTIAQAQQLFPDVLARLSGTSVFNPQGDQGGQYNFRYLEAWLNGGGQQGMPQGPDYKADPSLVATAQTPTPVPSGSQGVQTVIPDRGFITQ